MENAFRNGQRVIVTDPADVPHEELRGKSGTVVRVLIRSAFEACINMDDPLPSNLARFPDGDVRRNHICLWAEECSLIH